jgi:hypothetical protein
MPMTDRGGPSRCARFAPPHATVSSASAIRSAGGTRQMTTGQEGFWPASSTPRDAAAAPCASPTRTQKLLREQSPAFDSSGSRAQWSRPMRSEFATSDSSGGCAASFACFRVLTRRLPASA